MTKLTTPLYTSNKPQLDMTLYKNADKEAFDLTGATVQFAAKSEPSDTSYIIDATDVTIVSATGGTIRFIIDLTDVSAGTYIGELKATYTSPVKNMTLAQFKFNVLDSVFD